MSAQPTLTIRQHAEEISSYWESCPSIVMEHSQAILDALDKAKIQLPMFVNTGMGDVEFIDDVYTPEGAEIYRNARQHRLIPDPVVSGSTRTTRSEETP